MTIAIGGRALESRAFLAPMAGYTQLPLRRALRELGGIGLATTDLVQARLLLRENPRTLATIATAPGDEPLSVQIYGRDAAEIADATRFLVELGHEGVDLNMGCPMGRIHAGGGGAGCARDVDAATRVVAAAVEAVTVPVTVKMRLGWDRTSIRVDELARTFEDAGVAAITIHGRTRQQGFGGEVDLAGIRRAVESVRRIPIVGNGDVRTVEDYRRMRRETGCAAVAIGRGVLLDPWIFRKIAAADAGREPAEPTPAEQIGFLVRHFRLLAEAEGDRAAVLFRKFAGWYGARLGIPEDVEDRLRRIETAAEFDGVAAEIRARHGSRRSRVATALLKVPNGPVERW